MTIGVADLMWHGQNLESETFKGVEIMTAISFVYFLLSFVTIVGFRWLESLCTLPGSRR
jgi:ABC-type amino acid transport system permease subunit